MIHACNIVLLTAPPKRPRRITLIGLVCRAPAWQVRHHRMGTPRLREPEPWNPGRW